jgi:hypothetical protein
LFERTCAKFTVINDSGLLCHAVLDIIEVFLSPL